MLPRRLIKRDFSIVMICSHLTSVKSVNPFCELGVMRICNGNSRSVRLIEATIVKGYDDDVLPRSFCITNAGRVPRCSAPRPGDQFTSQISPRRGLGTPALASCWMFQAGQRLPRLITHANIPSQPALKQNWASSRVSGRDPR